MAEGCDVSGGAGIDSLANYGDDSGRQRKSAQPTIDGKLMIDPSTERE
jgi:hypothetical protein